MSDSKIAKDLIRPDDGIVKKAKERKSHNGDENMKIENLALLRCVTFMATTPPPPPTHNCPLP